MTSFAVIITAPVFPALTRACASPVRTNCAATLIELFRLRLTAVATGSSIVTTSRASTTSMWVSRRTSSLMRPFLFSVFIEFRVDQFRSSDQNDADAECASGLNCALDFRSGGVVATHRVHSNLQHKSLSDSDSELRIQDCLLRAGSLNCGPEVESATLRFSSRWQRARGRNHT